MRAVVSLVERYLAEVNNQLMLPAEHRTTDGLLSFVMDHQLEAVRHWLRSDTADLTIIEVLDVEQESRVIALTDTTVTVDTFYRRRARWFNREEDSSFVMAAPSHNRFKFRRVDGAWIIESVGSVHARKRP